MSLKTNITDKIFVTVFCLGYLTISLYTAPHYSITWDEAETDWYHAERNLNYLLSFDNKWLDFNQKLNPAPWPDHPELFALSGPFRTLNFGNMISAIGCRVFYHRLHLVGAIEAHHIPDFLLVAGVMTAIFFFMRRKFGLLAAAVSMAAFAFQPHFWANTHFNTKDIPYACMMAFTMLTAREAVIRRKVGLTILAAVLLGLSGGIKPNAALIPAILVIWYIISHKEIGGKSPVVEEKRKKINRIIFLVALALSPAVALAAFIVSWPYLWFNTSTRFGLFIEHYLSVAGSGPDIFQWDTLYMFVAAQPPAILIFGVIGISAAIGNIVRGKDRDESSFLLLWFCVPVLRMSLPKVLDYDGVRHFIEYALPLGALTGIGVSVAYKWLASRIMKWVPHIDRSPAAGGTRTRWGACFSAFILAAPFAAWFFTMVRIHPYEVAYYNFLVGGTAGANARWMDATDYWGSSYKQGIAWLNANAEQGATVVAPVGGYVVGSVRRMWLRSDIALVVLPYTEKMTAEEYLGACPAEERLKLYAIYITKRGWYNRFARDADSQWQERFSIRVDGAPILKIMKAPLPQGG